MSDVSFISNHTFATQRFFCILVPIQDEFLYCKGKGQVWDGQGTGKVWVRDR